MKRVEAIALQITKLIRALGISSDDSQDAPIESMDGITNGSWSDFSAYRLLHSPIFCCSEL